jgi:hypothetical protein
MVGSNAARTLTMVTLVILALVPLTTGAQVTPVSTTVYHYSTLITPYYNKSYPIAGHLDLEILPNGIVRGYYHNAFQKEFVPIAGGRDGNYLWFNIGPTIVDLGLFTGPNGIAHVVATMSGDNSFRGQIYPEPNDTTRTGEGTTPLGLPVTNLPTANRMAPFALQTPSDPVPAEQYIFTGKPVEKSSEDYPGTSTTQSVPSNPPSHFR